jgi:dipeptidase E
MKLLLTSGGIRNKSLENALRKLVGEKIRIAFIPTAANAEKGDKEWLITDLYDCSKLGEVDIVDISAMDKKEWLPRLEWANVIYAEGGDTTYLLRWILKSGLDKELPRLLKERVYVGVSAGSIVLSKEIQASSEYLYGDEVENAPKGLGYVDFHIRPHLNSPHFPKVIDKNLKEVSKKLNGDLYAIDDNTAILYENGKIEIISEGKWIKYSKTL